MCRSLVALSALMFFAAMSRAEDHPIIWDNYPQGTGVRYVSSQVSWGYFDSQCADDFEFDSDTPITAVQWNGGYWDYDPSFPADWNIFFYEDFFGMPPGGPNDPSNWAVSDYFFYASTVQADHETNGSWTITAELTPPFVAEAGQKYWIAIQADLIYPPQWGISDSATLQETQAHSGFPLIGVDYWTPLSDVVGVPTDMAFRLFAFVDGCPADVNGDGKVNIDDLFHVLNAWGTCDDCPEDINNDGKVNIDDVFVVLANWGPCP